MSEQAGSILVVDDEQLNLDMLSRRLRRSGFSVEVAASGQEALEKLRWSAIDLILLDQMMPDLSGTDVLRKLRANHSQEALPVIMVTAIAESSKIAEALESGANDYITKPIDYTVALARIRSQLARKRAETELRQSEERYALASQASQEGLWDWNLISDEIYYSPRWKQMLGLPETDGDSSPLAWFSRILSTDREATEAAIQGYLKGTGTLLKCSYRIRHSDGSIRWMTCRGVLTRNSNGSPVRLAGSQSDVTEEKTRDSLTGLPNRLPLLARLECEFERVHAERERGETATARIAVLFLDLDGFKTINDSFGHLAGDLLLRMVAERIHQAALDFAAGRLLVTPPLLSRMGGDEFSILLETEPTPASALELASIVQRAMIEPFKLERASVRCTCSIGVALGEAAQGRPEDVLRDADAAMYSAKLRGRGEVAVFALEMRDSVALQAELETGIMLAAKNNELVVYYQPKVNLQTGAVYGVEALVRWNHPTRGLLQPASFIPLGEKTGAIVDIGRWVLRESCRQVELWHREFPMLKPLELSVNLSPLEFKRDDLTDTIRDILAETGFPPSCLHLEITESVLVEDMEKTRGVLTELKATGIGLEVDDFGSGYSSLRYLAELPFDVLKIDRYFTANLDSNKPSTIGLIEAIISMASHLGLKVIAEGIATAPHNEVLRKLGCRFGQGFYFSKPVPAEQLHSMLSGCDGDGMRPQRLLAATSAEPVSERNQMEVMECSTN